MSSSIQSKRREKIKRRNLLLENLEDRRVMAAGPDLASIQPTTGSLLTAGSILRVSPRDLTFKFSNEVPETLDPASLSTLFGKSSIRIARAGGDANFNNGTVPINPGFIGLGDSGLEVIMRFAQPLPDDSYRIIISGDPSVAGTDLKDTAGNLFNDGKDFKLDFQIELGAQILAVVPQPVVRDATTGVLSQQSNKIDVYFNDDPLDSASVQNVNFYQLIITGNTVSPADDAVVKPTSVTYSLAQNKATLTFASSLTTLNPTNSALRLRIGTNQALDPTLYAPVAANDPLSTFGGALNVGALDGTTSNKVYSDSISPKPYDIVWPGGNNDPGHRDNPAFSNWTETTPFGPLDGEKHLNDGQADGVNGINIRYYNFKNFLGTISDGRGGFQPAFNVITENQKQRAREIFELYSRYSGIQFIESQDLGLTVATADLRVKDPSIPSEPGGVAGLGGGNSSVMDSAETWNDGYGENWFQVAMHEIGHSLGLGHTYDLAPLTIMGDDGSVVGQSPAPEGVFPGDNDIVHMQRLYRPEGQDIDMYKFTIPAGQTGMFSAETFAERLQNSSTPAAPLDTFLRLYRGTELIASNDDYFSKDSLIQLELGAGTYYIGVSAKGNDQYDPGVLDSGMGGTSEGAYKLSFNFRPNVAAANTIVDTTGTQFDGDADGVAGGVFNYWFKTATPIAQSATSHTSPRTLFVDRAAPNGGNGSLATPFNNIATALSKATVAGDIVRIVGNGGADGNLATAGDNLPYQIGFDQQTNAALRDGFTLNVPKNVTVMIDAGAILQLRRAGLQVGSSETTVSTDRSGGALQILGTPTQRVYFTSYNDQTIGVDSRPALNTSPTPGDWGGILFRNDLDNADGRFNWEDHGIFLNYVNFADIRYGGGSITVDNADPTLNAVHMVDARPTVTNNLITRNRDAAMSATPNSFAETNFREPIYQPDGTYAQSFSVDYGRIGPEIHGNTLYVKQGNSVFQNSLNGLLVRTATPAGSTLQEMTVPGRFNDTDIVHIVTENLVINGSPSGPYQEGGTPTTADPTITDSKPPIALIKNAELGGGSLDAGTYQYRLVYVDSFGNEGRASDVISVTVTGSGNSIRLGTLVEGELPQIPSRFVGMRVYRLGADNRWHFVDQVATSAKTFTDKGKAPVFDRILNPGLLTSTLGEALATNRPRPDGSLRIDPNIVVKFDRGRIEVEMGATMIAEGLAGQNVIFTSLSDDRFGAGATFDTRADGNANPAEAGEWGGIYAGPNSRLSLDRASIFYGGGLVQVGGDFAGFNAVEVQQADARIANSLIQFNASGVGGTAPAGRFGRGSNGTASIFVRGAQPVIVNNIIRDNLGAAININVNALNSNLVTDGGRQSGLIDRVAGHFDNNGPLIDENRLANNTLNGMVVRGGVLTTEGVWDDTDITHILLDLVSVTDVHTFGGLRLESSASESLVVKAQGSTAGFYANGRPLETDDRIGGILQVLGQPGFPVVITSLLDDTVGAGFQPDLSPVVDTNNDGSGGNPGGGGNDPVFPPATGELAVTYETNGMNLVNGMTFRPLPGGVTITNATYTGAPTAAGTYVNGDEVPLGILPRGILLTTGDANLPVSNTSSSFSQQHGLPGDADLDALSGGTTKDAAILEITINVTAASGIKSGAFNFQFGSEEFPEFVGDNFNDVLAGFINGGPATNFIRDSQNNLVSINSGFFNIDNQASALDVEYDGLTQGLTAKFPLKVGTNVLKLAIADGGDDAFDSGAFLTDLRFGTQDVGTGGVGELPGAGDWQGIVIDKYAHDRNVDTILEQERTLGLNDNTNTAQKLGGLASFQNGGADNLDKNFEYGGDENLRLGFTVHGNLASKTDLDVYKFKGIAGSQVWVDIDRTTSSLNTIVEVIDSKGAVIASSNNSHTNGGLTGAARPMAATSAFEGRDFFTTNVYDAGMRLVLPGAIGQSADYFVRVRSNGTSLTTGLTQGAYQLQIRLQEKDEFGGTVVRYSDIRFASTGIEVHGLPTHSPLAAEHGDVDANGGSNNTRGSAQNVGNALNVDRGALSIAGELKLDEENGVYDVDWYQFNVNVDKIQGFGPPDLLYSMMFDIDYADGLGRPNTVISIFDDQGRLILSSKDSNVADDQPPPLDAAGVADLLRGSVGNTDAMIGPVLLPAGIGGAAFPGGASKTYYVAVSSDAVLPPQWGQFFSPTSTEALARFQPLDSVHRIAEDHLDPTTQSRGTSELPEVQILLDGQSAVPFNLGDVTLFVNTRDDNRGGVDFNTSHLYTADPFTGAGETKVGAEGGSEIEDIGIRSDGGMFAFAQGLQKGLTTDAGSDDFVQIDTGNGAIISSVNTGMITYEPDGNNFAVAHPVNNTRVGWGVQFEALLFADLDFGGEQELVAVGRRGDSGFGYGDPNRNILYQFTVDGGGLAQWPNLPNGIGAGTNYIELGEIDTSIANGGTGGEITGMAKLPSNGKNDFYAIDDLGGLYLVSVNTLGANRNGATNVVTTTPIPSAAFELGGLDFQCLTAGPPNVEPDPNTGVGRYANTLFATTSTGRMYAFNTQGQLQPIFSEGATSIQLTDNEGVNLTQVRGLAFSELDRNLWGNNRGVMPGGVTPRDNDQGHGLPVTFNDSVRPFDDVVRTMPSTEADGGASVNSSYSFNAWHPHQGDPGSMNYTFNGGAYGTTISNEFSLKGYNSADLPTLYYTYFLNSEDTASGSGHQLRDSVRVFIAGNDGNWQQLGGDDQERDIADTRGENTRDVVGQRMFDNTGTWRQVRINLSDYAGQENLRLRFDFSTAGDMNVGDTETTGDELRAVAGRYITDGESFTVTRGATNQVFEFDSGVTIFTEPGSEFSDGDTLTITNNGIVTTFEFDTGNGVTAGNVAVAFAATDTAGAIATRLRNAILANVAGASVRYLGDDRLNLDFIDDAADTVTETSGGLTLVGQGGVAAGNIRVPVHRLMTRDEVAVEMDKVLEPFLSVQTLVVQGVASDFSDGDQFSLTVGSPQFGSQTFKFEFDNNSVVTPGFNAVAISGGAGQMANNIRTAISNALIGTGHTARWNINDRARVALQGQYTEEFTYNVLNGSFPLSLIDPTDLVKTHKDLVRIIDETVVDAGPLGLDNALDGDLTSPGALNSTSGFFSNTRGQDNLHEGVYIDDIIIGLAERGEIVTGSTNDSNYIPNAGLQENQNLVGPYTLEMRRGPTYDFPTILGDSPSFNTNQRLNQSVSIIADAGADIVEGSTFTLSDSVHQVTFEFDFDGSVKPGNIRVPFTADDTANVVASRIRDAINSFPAQQAFDISAQNADGGRAGISTNNQVNLLAGRFSKYATFVDEGPLQVVYNNQAYGDNNRYRDQGQLILDGNRVSNSANWGILIDDGSRDSGAPHTGPARILSQPNTTVPGVVVSNNVVSNSGVGAIRFSGSANPSGSEIGSIPFGRIINNTLYGTGGNSIGIQVDDNAAPTIVNNIIANFGTGVSVAADSQQNTVLDYSVYQSNGANTNGIAIGGSDIQLQPADPLFVNAAAGNFYPAPGSKVIDNSINTLVDRPSMVTVRNPLDIPPSPILAPERDATGSLRTDDESVVNQGGAGENPFKDRGALDRVDFVGPTSQLVNPLDNDPLGIDGDPTTTKVSLGNISLFSFEIQLDDVGIGIDDLTVKTSAVKLEQTFPGATRTLVDGIDYVFSYDSTNNKIILRPTGGIWPLSRNYRITLDNTGADGIRDLAGNLLQGNRVNGSVVYEILLGTAIDYGDAPASYGTTRAGNGASHQIRSAYKLGKQVTPDLDGQPSATASTDTFDDGLINRFLSPGLDSSMTVLAQGGGKLDAWLDRNFDGDFLDAGEHILVGVTLPNNVQKTLSFKFGSTSDKKGDSFLRLRYTSNGISSPVGPASDGEVEDYKVAITGPKYQNPNNPLDVDANGFVQPKDALLIGNLLDNFDLDGDGFLNPNTDLGNPPPNPPPYYDVNGDGRIGRDDANAVVNFINSSSSTLAGAESTNNHAPVLDDAPKVKLPAVESGATDPAGIQVIKLLRNAVTDADPNALKGIAVRGHTGYGDGTWQFKIDKGPWKNIGNVSDTRARLLPARAYVRFVPNAGFTGEVRLLYRAWDQTQGVPGYAFDTEGKRGGNNSVSLAAETAILKVTSSAAAAMSTTFASSSIVYEQSRQTPTEPDAPVDGIFAAVASTNADKKTSTSVTEDVADDFFSDF
jgi:hypothetical protein